MAVLSTDHYIVHVRRIQSVLQAGVSLAAGLVEMGRAMDHGFSQEVLSRVYPDLPWVSIDYGIMG